MYAKGALKYYYGTLPINCMSHNERTVCEHLPIEWSFYCIQYGYMYNEGECKKFRLWLEV